MNGRMQEDLAWSRLLDMQREMENARLYGGGMPVWRALGMLVGRGWLLAGLAQRRAPRRSQAAAPRKTAF